MTPHLERPEPVYMQLVSHYRDAIASGELREGERMPSVREIADRWQVAFTTAAKAMRQLAADGLVSTSKQGTIVTYLEHSTFSPADRLRSAQLNQLIYPHGVSKIIDAGMAEATSRVAEVMGIEVGAPVVRRERVTSHGEIPVTWSVTWMPGELGEQVPELLDMGPIPGGKGTIGAVKEKTGRFPKVGLDSYRLSAGHASAHVAQHLHIEEGDPVLLGENVWPEESGAVLEFGQFAIPQHQGLLIK